MKIDNKILINFGLRVKETRKNRGLSQEELAHKSNLHRTYIGMIERAEKNITLHVMPTEVNVAAEPALLEQALGNLLDNAIDFTPQGGTIELAAREEQGQIQLIVTDSGSGIPDYALDRIFERFYSLPRENGLKSSGLGLAFVQEVARLHQGEITLRNRDEGGVMATLILHRPFT